MNIKITLTPMGSKIKFRVQGKVKCKQNGQALSNSLTLDKEDQQWISIFGSKKLVKDFINKNKVVTKSISILKIYDECDYLAE